VARVRDGQPWLVTIEGESGVGKELIARAIQGESDRSGKPFVVVNCAAMHPDRLEIELFGMDTEADGPRKIGLFEQAHGGTLLLDEVAEFAATLGEPILVPYIADTFCTRTLPPDHTR